MDDKKCPICGNDGSDKDEPYGCDGCWLTFDDDSHPISNREALRQVAETTARLKQEEEDSLAAEARRLGDDKDEQARPKMGTWHTINSRAFKRRTPIAPTKRGTDHLGSDWNYTERIEWKREPTPPCNAMYVGHRRKFNGITEHWIDDRGFTWKGTVEVWMFVTHENRNPIAVMPFEWEEAYEIEQAALKVAAYRRAIQLLAKLKHEEEGEVDD